MVWLQEDQENPRLLFEVALVLDNQGREAEAIPYYERALAGDLDRTHQIDAYIGLGSSLRVVGRIHESRQIMERALQQFPRHLALQVFYAFTLERIGNFGDALSLLLDVILESAKEESIDAYRPALRYYRNHRHDSSGE